MDRRGAWQVYWGTVALWKGLAPHRGVHRLEDLRLDKITRSEVLQQTVERSGKRDQEKRWAPNVVCAREEKEEESTARVGSSLIWTLHRVQLALAKDFEDRNFLKWETTKAFLITIGERHSPNNFLSSLAKTVPNWVHKQSWKWVAFSETNSRIN